MSETETSRTVKEKEEKQDRFFFFCVTAREAKKKRNENEIDSLEKSSRHGGRRCNQQIQGKIVLRCGFILGLF